MDQQDERGLSTRIGGLTSKIANTAIAKATAMNGSTARPPNSEIAAWRGPTNTDTPISTQRGAPTSSEHLTSLPAIIGNPRSLALLRRNPAQFLPPSIRSAIVEAWVDGDTSHGWDGYVARYDVGRPLDEHDRGAALAFLDDALLPAGEDLVLTELARLRAITASRDVGQDLALVFSAYADELQRYPADAVCDVLRNWRGKFWPTWAELAERLDRIVKPRHALRSAIERGYRKPDVPPEQRVPLSDEGRREIDELLARHGIRLDHRGRVRPMEREPLPPMNAADQERMEQELAAQRARWTALLLADETTAGAA
jgi:hypothetical protein